MKPICVCPGIAKGRITFFQKGKKFSKKDIVVMKDWLTQNVMAAKDAAAIISSTGSITCHASIIARELNIPTLINVDTSNLKKDQKIEINTIKGLII